jgi:hypothetical protein
MADTIPATNPITPPTMPAAFDHWDVWGSGLNPIVDGNGNVTYRVVAMIKRCGYLEDSTRVFQPDASPVQIQVLDLAAYVMELNDDSTPKHPAMLAWIAAGRDAVIERGTELGVL